MHSPKLSRALDSRLRGNDNVGLSTNIKGIFLQPLDCLGADVIHYSANVPCFQPHIALAIGASAALHDCVDVFALFPRSEIVDDIINKVEQFQDELGGIDFLFAAEVDHLALNAISRGTPLVLHDECATIRAEPKILRAKLVQLCGDGLHECRQANRLVGAHRDIADADFEGWEYRMRAHIPPDLAPSVDAASLDKKLDEVLKLAVVGKTIGDIRTRIAIEYLRAEALEAGIGTEPERRVGTQRQQMRKEVPKLVHNLNLQIPILDADVDMEPEYQICASNKLHFLDQAIVSLVWIDLLIAPVGKRMCAGRRDSEALTLCKFA